MSLMIKCCGMMQETDIDAAIDAGATHIGLVHCPPSPRHVSLGRAAELVAHVGERAQAVIVLQNADDATLTTIANTVKPSVIQLHGNESPQQCIHARNITGATIIKAFAVNDADSLQAIPPYEGFADMLLLDAKAPTGSTYAGGHGLNIDWTLLHNFNSPMPWFLAGGLSAGNVTQAISIAKPNGVDASSSLEASKGLKSLEKIKAFLIATHVHGDNSSTCRTTSS